MIFFNNTINHFIQLAFGAFDWEILIWIFKSGFQIPNKTRNLTPNPKKDLQSGSREQQSMIRQLCARNPIESQV